MSLPRYPEYKDSGVEWLGSMPSGWDLMRLMRAASVNDETLPETTPPDFEMAYVDIGSVSLDRGIERTESFAFQNAPSRARRLVRDGDVLISTVRTYLKAIAPVLSPPNNMVVSTGFAVVRPKEKLRSGFARYALQAGGFVDQIISRSTGVSYPAINASDLVRVSIPMPPLDEQAAIAAFLDRETAKIDALIAEQGKLTVLLAEKRQATITHTVTRGLNPDAPMKDSGVAWLGDVPAHWKVIPLGRISTDRCDGPFGSGIKSEHYTEEGALVVRLQNIRAGAFNAGEPVYLDEHYFLTELLGHEVLAGDVLVAGLGDENNLLGRACVAPPHLGRALVKADCFRFRLRTEIALPMFIALQLSAGAAFDAGTLATGTTRSRIPLSTMASRKVALPPTDEQAALANFISTETGKLDALKAEAECGITLLKERRSALISAAVTGQIDVRGVIAPQSQEAALAA